MNDRGHVGFLIKIVNRWDVMESPLQFTPKLLELYFVLINHISSTERRHLKVSEIPLKVSANHLKLSDIAETFSEISNFADT